MEGEQRGGVSAGVARFGGVGLGGIGPPHPWVAGADE